MQSVLVVQGQIFVQSPLRVKSAKANCAKEITKKIHMQTGQTTLPEIGFKMQQLYKAKIENCCMY